MICQGEFQERACSDDRQIGDLLVKIAEGLNGVWCRLNFIEKEESPFWRGFILVSASISRIIISVSQVLNILSKVVFFSRFTSTSLISLDLANCLTRVDFPTCRALLVTSGFRLSFLYQLDKYDSANLFILSLPPRKDPHISACIMLKQGGLFVKKYDYVV